MMVGYFCQRNKKKLTQSPLENSFIIYNLSSSPQMLGQCDWPHSLIQGICLFMTLQPPKSWQLTRSLYSHWGWLILLILPSNQFKSVYFLQQEWTSLLLFFVNGKPVQLLSLLLRPGKKNSWEEGLLACKKRWFMGEKVYSGWQFEEFILS